MATRRRLFDQIAQGQALSPITGTIVSVDSVKTFAIRCQVS